MKKNSFLKTMIHIGTGTVINMLLGLLFTPILTRIVEPDVYGELSIFNLYINISALVLCLGMDQTLLRFFYKSDSMNYKKWLLKTCVSISMAAMLVSITLFVIVISTGILQFEFENILMLFIFGVFFELLYRFSSILIRLCGEGSLYSKATIIYKASFFIVSILIMTLTNKKNIYILALSTVMGYFFAVLFSVIKKRTYWNFFSASNLSDVDVKSLLKYGLPFVVSTGLTTLFEAVDKLSLKYYCDYSTVGIYSSAIQLTAVFAIVQGAFNIAWAPKVVEHYEKNPEDKNYYSKCNEMVSAVMFLFGLTFILLKDFFGIVLGEKFRMASTFVPFLAFHPIMYTISETTVIGIVVKKKSQYHIAIAAISCAVNLFGNMLLVPHIGAKGAAISTGLSYIVFYVMRTVLANRLFSFNHYKARFWISTGLTLVFAFYNTFWENNAISAALYFVFVGILVVLFRSSFLEMCQYAKSTLHSIKK